MVHEDNDDDDDEREDAESTEKGGVRQRKRKLNLLFGK
jgi:hypothetical protein